MGQPAPLHSVYVGMARDMARDQLPPGYVWNLQDFFPTTLGAPLRKRGGFVWASSAVTSASAIEKVMYGKTDNQVRFGLIDSSSAANLYTIDAPSTGALTFVGSITASSAGGPVFTTGDPVHYNNQFIIPIQWTAAASGVAGGTWGNPTAWNGSSLVKITSASSASADESVAGFRYGTIYKDRLVLGNGPGHQRQIRFSAAGDPTDFSDATSWIDTAARVTGLAGIPNCLLIFSAEATQRIRGSIPPPDSDMFLDRLNDYGCIDYRSIDTWNGQAIYCDTNGVYQTDGINTVDLTQQGLISLYFQELLGSFNTNWTLRGGVFRDHYYLVIVNDSNAFVDCLVCHLRSRAWFRLQNFNFRHFTEAKGVHQDFYAAGGDVNRVVRITDILLPSADNKADADGDTVLPVVEYPMRRGFHRVQRRWLPAGGLTHFKRLYMSYSMSAASADDPTLTISYVTDPQATSYTSLGYTLPETTGFKRAGRSFGPAGARGGITELELGVKVAQTGASTDTRLFTLEAEMEAIEGSALTQ